MNSESYQIETRRRSRSKTPFLRSNCDHENCEHAGEEGHVHHTKKKSSATPNVQTIIEEHVEQRSSTTRKPPIKSSNIAELTIGEQLSAGGRVQRTTTQGRKGIATASSSSAVMTTSSAVNSSSATTVTKTTSQTIVTNTKKTTGGLSTSTPKESIHGNKLFEEKKQQLKQHNESTQNVLNSVQEKQQQQQEQQKHSTLRSFYNSFIGNKSNYNTGNGDIISDHIAYQDYKRAGEYWNVTPKTDYTYSELSPHRRELAPGVVAMPNMSRRSLENHSQRVNVMVARNPSQEQYIRRRYEADYASQRRAAANLNYDSTDEVDITQFSNRRRHQYGQYGDISERSWFMRIITTIVTTITSVYTKVTGGGGGDVYQEEDYYRRIYGRQQQQQKLGFFASIYHGITSGVLSLGRYVYMFISSVLLLDTILLKSSNADNKRKKRFLIFLLILLPLLLLAGWWLLDTNDRQHYIQQTQTLLPISLLAGLRSSLYTAGTSLRGLLQLPGLIWPANNAIDEDKIAQEHLYKFEQNIQKSLTPEEYENILNHVNSYVQQLIELKMKKQQSEQLKHAERLTPGQIQIIVQLMRENLERVMEEQRAYDSSKAFVLSDAEVQRIAGLVQLELKTHGDWPAQRIQLTVENLDEIKKLIKQQIDIHNHAHYTLLVERIDLDALLARILGAKQLADFVDARINIAIDKKITQLRIVEGSGEGGKVNVEYEQKQAHLINDLNNEIAFIKLSLSNKQSEVANLHQSISDLKLTQDDLLKRMQNHELATDKRFSGLLAEIESKLATLNDTQFTLLNKQVKLTLVEILGFKQSTKSGDVKLDDIDLQNWVRSMFVAKDYLEQRLMDLNKRTNNLIRDEIERSSILLMHDISERLKNEIILFVESKHNQSTDTLKTQIRSALSEKEVRSIVKSVLSIYDADKTGLVDFALESAGGQILSTRCTESFQTKSAQLSIFGIPLWYPTNTPRVAISPNVQPGECWAFQGFPGFLVLKLNTLVYVTGFTLEHIPKSLSPTGRIESAPKTFTVWGLAHEKDQDPVQLGEYEYVDNDASLQYFPTQNVEVTRPYQIVELRIESNHGEPKYTCLYRFRVHGKPQAT